MKLLLCGCHMKRVAILVNEFAPAQGGVGNQAYYLARYLSEVCEKVIVITFHQTSKDYVFDKQQPFKIYRRNKQRWNPLNLYKFVHNISKIINDEKINTVVTSNYFFLWMLPLLRLNSHKQSYITIVHGKELCLPNFLQRCWSQIALNFSHKIIAVSDFTKNIIEKSGFWKNVHVCKIGIPDELLIDQTREHQTVLKVSTVGAYTIKKGYNNVFNVLPDFFKMFPNSKYKVSGLIKDEDFKKDFHNKLNTHAFGTRIEIEPSFPNADINKIKTFFNDVSIYMALAEHAKSGDVEGYGIALLEANACGVPVVATNNFGFRETVKDRYSGILVNPHNKEEVLAAIDEIVRNYSTYSTNAKKWAYEHRWSKLYKSYYNVINS